MADTFSQIYIHLVFAVRARDNLIQCSWETELYKYINGIISRKEQKPLALNGMPDHIHILIGMKPSCRISDLVREIKKSSHEFVHERNFTKSPFYWQEGYGAFSYSRSELDRIIGYINAQKQHHAKSSFRDEYINILEKFQIEHKPEYLFEWLDH